MPWVPSRVLDALLAAAEHNRRMERREVGLPEAPPKPREPPPEIPYEVAVLCNAWSNQASRDGAKARALKLFKEEGDWKVVQQILTQEMGGGDE